MQEDVYYSKYLEHQYAAATSTAKPPPVDLGAIAKPLADRIVTELGPELESQRAPIEKIVEDSELDRLTGRVARLRSLSELYYSPGTWHKIVKEWGLNSTFRKDIDILTQEGVVSMEKDNYLTCNLTELGLSVGNRADSLGSTWKQQNEEGWDRLH